MVGRESTNFIISGSIVDNSFDTYGVAEQFVLSIPLSTACSTLES